MEIFRRKLRHSIDECFLLQKLITKNDTANLIYVLLVIVGNFNLFHFIDKFRHVLDVVHLNVGVQL